MKRIRSEEYYIRNRERGKQRYEENKSRIKEYRKLYWENKSLTIEGRCKKLLNGAASRSKSKSLPFDIDLPFLISLWEQQKGKCLISGIPFDLSKSETKFNKYAPSLDKIIPEKGYVKGNVRLVCWHVNVAIAEYGLDDFIFLCNSVSQHIKGNK